MLMSALLPKADIVGIGLELSVGQLVGSENSKPEKVVA